MKQLIWRIFNMLAEFDALFTTNDKTLMKSENFEEIGHETYGEDLM